jgi:hypothetical protein
MKVREAIMHVNKYVLGLGCSFGFAMAAACGFQGERLNEKHCWNKSGDATCEELYGDALPFCSNEQSPCMADGKYGCVAERPTDECYSPCGDEQSFVENNECELIADGTETGESGGESTSSGSVDSESGSESMGEAPCEPACDNPMLCQGGECVECTSIADAACVETGWCDEATFSCEECTSHFQCPGGAGCHLEEGTCLPSDRVFEVGSESGLSLESAMMMLDSQDGTIIIQDDTLYSLSQTFLSSKDQVVAVVAPPGVRPTINRVSVDNAPEFAFEQNSGHLYLWGIDLSGAAGVKVSESGTLHAEKVGFDTDFGAVVVSKGHAQLRSCMLISDGTNEWSTLGVEDEGSADVKFSTILARDGDNALTCVGASEIDVYDSILGSLTGPNGIGIDMACTSLIETSAVEHLGPNQGDFAIDPSTKVVGAFEAADFPQADAGKLHLVLPAAKFELIAECSDDDPRDDFDGDTRTTQGSTWPGADTPK